MGLETSTWRRFHRRDLATVTTATVRGSIPGYIWKRIPQGVGDQWLHFGRFEKNQILSKWKLGYLSLLVSIHELYLFVRIRISSKTCLCSILDAFIFLDLKNYIITSISYTLVWMLFGHTNIGGSLKIQRPYNLIQSVCLCKKSTIEEHTSFGSGGVPLILRCTSSCPIPPPCFSPPRTPTKHFRKLPNSFPRTEIGKSHFFQVTQIFSHQNIVDG